MTGTLRLGVNIDHVATVRNARGGTHPDPVRAARLAIDAGADGITVHLREDRRHIRDADVYALKQVMTAPINLEMAATEEMMAIALDLAPRAVCLVPERREEVTTEGGLDVAGQPGHISRICDRLGAAGIRVSLFIDPDPRQVAAAIAAGAAAVELHTGEYAHAVDAGGNAAATEVERLQRAAVEVVAGGLECHAGHGLSTRNVGPVAAIRDIVELNIGHYLVGEAIFTGFDRAIAGMLEAMARARGESLRKGQA